MAAPEGPERMPISPRGRANKRPGAAGFTLIELLVVVTLIAILSVGVGLGTGGVFSRASDSPSAVAQRFSDAMTQARDAAILGRAPVGLRVQQHGWVLERRSAEGEWHASVPPVSSARADLFWVIDGRSYRPPIGAPSPGQAPPVVFLPDGRNSVVSLEITSRNDRVRCEADGWGAVACR